MDNIRLYIGVLMFLCLFSLLDYEKVNNFITEQKILKTYKNSEKMLGFGVIQYENGIYIVDVLDMTPAKKAGIEEWDKIISCEGCEVKDVKEFKKMIELFNKNKSLNLIVYRKSSGQDIAVSIKPMVFIPQN